MSPAPARTSRAAIVAAGRELLEEGGLEAVSMAAVAERVGVRAPSLYKHVADRNALIAAMATATADDLAVVLEAAAARGRRGPEARLRAVADAYRAFARKTPRSAALLFASPAPDAVPTPESQLRAAGSVLRLAEDLTGPADALPAARAITAFVFGFSSMEGAGAFRFGGNVDAAWDLGLDALVAGLAGRPAL